MKRFKATGSLLKSLVLAGLVSACNNDQTIIPSETSATVIGDDHAKINATLKLIKYGTNNVQYVKSGKFMGLVSMTSNATSYMKYTYNDNNGTTNLFITMEGYSKATNIKAGESIFEISNGKCISRKNSDGSSTEYKYNAAGLLEEATSFYPNSLFAKYTYSYVFNAATNTYRLNKVNTSNNGGPVHEAAFTYTVIPEKYQLNPENNNTEPLMPYFGKFSDVLIKDIEVKSTSGTQWTNFREYTYVLDANGYPTSRTQVYHPFGKGSNASLSTSTMDFKYSQYWQGI